MLLQILESRVEKEESHVREPLTGQAYWDFLERTSARVSTWPEWKIGRRFTPQSLTAKLLPKPASKSSLSSGCRQPKDA